MTTILILSGIAYGGVGGGQQPAQIARQAARMGHVVYHYQPGISPITFEDGVVEIPCPRHLVENLWTASAKGAADHWRPLLEGLTRDEDRWLVVTCALPWYIRGAEVAQSLGWKVCYWIIDDWEALYAGERSDHYRRDDERKIIRQADLLCLTAETLRPKAGNRAATCIPNGFDSEDFPLLTRSPIEEIGHLSVIYWGSLRGEWFDWDLLAGLAMSRPQWAFHLIGPHPQSPPALQNVMYHGTAPVHWLSRLSGLGDVAIVPFRPGPAIDGVDPIKAYEYLACGLPIVSCRMPQLDGWPGVAQVPNIAPLWIEAIEATAKRGIDPEARAAHLHGRSWRDRTQAFLAEIGNATVTDAARKPRSKRGA